MKQFKTLVALVLALMLTLSVASVAFAADGDTVKIEITRDDSYDGTGDGNVYTWYRVFTATYTPSNTSTGGDSTDGAPGDVTGTATAAAYTASSAVAAKLGTWSDSTDPKWTKASGNLWFDLTPIVGTTNYSVKWVATDTDSATAQAAAQWLFDNDVYDANGPLTFADGKFSATGLQKGYYLINGASGKNLIAATTDITVKEKNEYPPLEKLQADEDESRLSTADRSVAVGDIINYQIEVTIPATAKVGDTILVWDKASEGLEFVANSLDVTDQGATVTDPATADVDSSWDWSKLITVTAASVGKTVTFEFDMKVTSNALIDTEKENESGLKYGHDGNWKYDSKPVEVKYKTYFAGIKKIDGKTNEDLAGVEFTLKEAGVEFTVSKPTGKDYYVFDENGSSTVVTDANGMIKIRGLDNDKTYTLTETKTLDGYNMLDKDKTLTLEIDTITVTDNSGTTTTTVSYNDKTNDQFDKVENNKGTLLPSTGGIGTTIFYIAGAVLVLGAAAIVIARRKADQH